jgi:hypothetical protein
MPVARAECPSMNARARAGDSMTSARLNGGARRVGLAHLASDRFASRRRGALHHRGSISLADPRILQRVSTTNRTGTASASCARPESASRGRIDESGPQIGPVRHRGWRRRRPAAPAGELPGGLHPWRRPRLIEQLPGRDAPRIDIGDWASRVESKRPPRHVRILGPARR